MNIWPFPGESAFSGVMIPGFPPFLEQIHRHGFHAGVLQNVSARWDTVSRLGLAEGMSEICLALEKSSSDWVASESELEHFNNTNTERAEATFSQYRVQLGAKVRRMIRLCVGRHVFGIDFSWVESYGEETSMFGLSIDIDRFRWSS